MKRTSEPGSSPRIGPSYLEIMKRLTEGRPLVQISQELRVNIDDLRATLNEGHTQAGSETPRKPQTLVLEALHRERKVTHAATFAKPVSVIFELPASSGKTPNRPEAPQTPKASSIGEQKENAAKFTPKVAKNLLDQGVSRKEMATRFGVSLGTVNDRMWKSKVPPGRLSRVQVDEEAIVRAFRNGTPTRAIAAQMDVPESSIRYRLKKAGLI